MYKCQPIIFNPSITCLCSVCLLSPCRLLSASPVSGLCVCLLSPCCLLSACPVSGLCVCLMSPYRLLSTCPISVLCVCLLSPYRLVPACPISFVCVVSLSYFLRSCLPVTCLSSCQSLAFMTVTYLSVWKSELYQIIAVTMTL